MVVAVFVVVGYFACWLCACCVFCFGFGGLLLPSDFWFWRSGFGVGVVVLRDLRVVLVLLLLLASGCVLWLVLRCLVGGWIFLSFRFGVLVGYVFLRGFGGIVYI